MDNILEETHLMQQNRQQLVATLNSLGFSEVNDTTPLSELAEYMKWAGGLRDIRLACLHKTTKAQAFFTRAEWDGFGANAKSQYIMLGVCIRAERQQFIVAKANALSDSNSLTMQWAPNNSNNVKNLTDFYGMPSYLDDIDGEKNTDAIIQAITDNGIDYPAARIARAWKASTKADGGIDDPTTWSLPAIGQLWLLYKYFNDLNTEITYYFGSSNNIIDDWYWSSTECSSAYAWGINMPYGLVSNGNKGNGYRVRPVAPVVAAAASAI
jgi:hypothetical protein